MKIESTPTLRACPNHPTRQGIIRGVCKQCYDTMAQRVTRGQATWEQLEAEGAILPRKPGGRPRKAFSPITK